MPRLVRQDRDRPPGPGKRLHAVLERELVEAVAQRRNEVRRGAADLRDAVGVLDDADMPARGVADDRGGVVGDLRRLLREDGFGPGAVQQQCAWIAGAGLRRHALAMPLLDLLAKPSKRDGSDSAYR